MPTNTCTALVVRPTRTKDEVAHLLKLWIIGAIDDAEFNLLPEEEVLLMEWSWEQPVICSEHFDLRGMNLNSYEAEELEEQYKVQQGEFCEHRLPWRQCTYCAPF